MDTITKDNFDEVELRVLQQRLEGLSRLRWVLLPLFVALLLTTLLHDRSVWRWTIVGLFLLSGVGRAIKLRARRPVDTCQPRREPRLSALGLVPLLALLLATGGIDSPLLPCALVICFFVGTFSTRRLVVASALMLGVQVVVFALLAYFQVIPDLMPAIYGGGPQLPQPATLLAAKTLTFLFLLVWTAISARTVRGTFRGMVNEAVEARDEVLRNHEAHAQELTVLSGELAHELKNPLANLKGLAVLVSRDVQGKGGERLAVMQKEIVRMEGILNDFLTFSRPLSPLSQETIELRELAASVLALHEGTALSRNVRVVLLDGAPLTVACDPRKVKQILINLLQNALEAAPRDTVVTLTIGEAPAKVARVEVRDDGPGLTNEMEARLFQPGATDKPGGTGLGLTLARGLARQHGGDLTLTNRAEGGCVATFILPRETAKAAA